MVIIDTGLGNLRSVQKGFEEVGSRAEVSADPAVVRRASRVVLPGVGAFGDCMARLRRSGLADAAREVVDAGRPFLGICLGLQVLLDHSEEFGRSAGLGWIPGRVTPLAASPGIKVPHMGWNRVTRPRSHPVLGPEGPGDHYYFAHSLHARPEDPDQVAAWCEHGSPFVAAVADGDNVLAVQFHPEKSQGAGLALLRGFARWSP